MCLFPSTDVDAYSLQDRHSSAQELASGIIGRVLATHADLDRVSSDDCETQCFELSSATSNTMTATYTVGTNTLYLSCSARHTQRLAALPVFADAMAAWPAMRCMLSPAQIGQCCHCPAGFAANSSLLEPEWTGCPHADPSSSSCVSSVQLFQGSAARSAQY